MIYNTFEYMGKEYGLKELNAKEYEYAWFEKYLYVDGVLDNIRWFVSKNYRDKIRIVNQMSSLSEFYLGLLFYSVVDLKSEKRAFSRLGILDLPYPFRNILLKEILCAVNKQIENQWRYPYKRE